jgi:hypothetical protein
VVAAVHWMTQSRCHPARGASALPEWQRGWDHFSAVVSFDPRVRDKVLDALARPTYRRRDGFPFTVVRALLGLYTR